MSPIHSVIQNACGTRFLGEFHHWILCFSLLTETCFQVDFGGSLQGILWTRGTEKTIANLGFLCFLGFSALLLVDILHRMQANLWFYVSMCPSDALQGWSSDSCQGLWLQRPGCCPFAGRISQSHEPRPSHVYS